MLKTVEDHLRANMHRYNVSTTMFCPKCGHVLDCRKSVSIDLMKDGKEAVKSWCFCNSCYDAEMPSRIKSALKDNYTVEVYHGKTRKHEVIS